MNFSGKTFWITGASSGIGKEVAVALAKFNTHIIISGRDITRLKITAEEIEKNGSTTRIEVLDMLNTDSIIKTAKRLLLEHEKIAGLYHFAGISQRSLLIETPLENTRKIMEINFFGVVALTNIILPSMVSNGEGQIAVASSLVGKFGFPYRSAYASSKHALHGYFETLLAENHDKNIRISMLMGGRIRTNIYQFAIDKDGHNHGKMDEGQDKGISPKKAAQQILKGLKKDRRDINVGGNEFIMLKI
jgi:short-subunit dehydrogenase